MKIKHLITTVVIALCLVFAVACGGSDGDTFAAPSPTLDGATVSWNAVKGAESYTVTVNGSQFNVTDTTFTITVTEPGEYDIYVTAVKGDEKKTSKKLTYIYGATLAAPVLSLSGNVVSWQAIANATSYDVYVNDELKQNTTLLRYAITEEEIGSYIVKVKAKGGAGYGESALSSSVTYVITNSDIQTETLDAPVIALEKRTVSWEKVENATSYKILVDGVEYATVTDGTSYNIPLRSEGEYTITVQAQAPATNYMASDESNAVTFTVGAFDITKPVVAYILGNGATVDYSEDQGRMIQFGKYNDSGLDDDFITRAWRFIAAGNYYKIKLNNGAYLTSAGGASYAWYEAESGGDGQLWELRTAGNGKYFILNKAVGEYLYCADGDTSKLHFYPDSDSDLQRWALFNVDVEFDADMRVLGAPTLAINGNTVSWTAVDGAEAYKVYVNDVLADTVTRTEYVISAEAEGLYSVTVKSTGTDALDSAYSNRVDYMHSTLELLQPIYATYTVGETVYVATADDNGYVVLVEAAGITDFAPYMWYLESDGNYYNIKFANGWYLTRVANGDTGAEAILAPKSGSAEQQWHLTPDGFNMYKLSNVSHSNQWAGGNLNTYFYGDISGVLKFADNTHAWLFANKNISFGNVTKLAAPTVTLDGAVASWVAVSGATAYEIYVNGEKADTVTTLTYTLGNSGDSLKVKAVSTAAGTESSYFSNTVTYTDLFANPVVAYYGRPDYQKVLKINDDGTIEFGDSYGDITDYSAYLWTLEKLDNGYYMIRLADGRYLSFSDTGGVNSIKAAEKDETSSWQWWILVPDGDGGYMFKLENVYFKNYYPNVYLGEWYGLAYNGACYSWVFVNPDDNN